MPCGECVQTFWSDLECPFSSYPNYHNENLKFCTWRGFPMLNLNIQIPLNCSSMLRMKAEGSSETTGHYDPTRSYPTPKFHYRCTNTCNQRSQITCHHSIMLIRHMCKRGLGTSSHFLVSSLLLLSSSRKGLCHHTVWQN